MIVPVRERYMMSGYSGFSSSRLQQEIETLRSKIEGADETVFMRMFHELLVYQMELELQYRELRDARNELLEIRERYVDLYDFAPMPYFTFDEHGTILELNLSAAELIGKDRLGLIGRTFVDYVAQHQRSIFLEYVKNSIGGDMDHMERFALELPSGQSVQIKAVRVVSQLSSGNVDACRMAFMPEEYLPAKRGTVQFTPGYEWSAGSKQDIRLAFYDDLTGLVTRGLLYDRLQQGLIQSRRDKSMIAVLFLEISADMPGVNLKYVPGDAQVLQEVAERMSYYLREGDTLSRLNEREFVAVVRNVADSKVPSEIASRIVSAMERPFYAGSEEVKLKVNIGISISPQHGGDVTDLLKNADMAMRQSMLEDKSGYLCFAEEMKTVRAISSENV